MRRQGPRMQHATGPSRKVIPKACDACRRRKIKCNGLQPCLGCSSANLACTWNSPRGLGGNRGVRATIINELRAEQQQNGVLPQPGNSPGTPPANSPSANSAATPVGRIGIETCIDTYLDRIHAVVPLLDAAILGVEVAQMDNSPISRQLILAFCAYVANSTKLSSEGTPQSPRYADVNPGRHFLESALSVVDSRRVTEPTPHSVYISFFLYGAYAGQGDYRQAWFYLREATTLFMMLRTDKLEGWYDERARRRLFWILVVSERSHAVRRNRPITLQVSSTSPLLDTAREYGLHCLAAIFRPLDEVFFAVWNGSSQDCSKEWLLRLENNVRFALPPTLSMSDEEVANLRVSQYWVQIKLWELFPRFSFLSTESVYECLTFRYPIVVARDLTTLGFNLPIASLQVHGVGMTEKVFDVACALADVIPFLSDPASNPGFGPPDYLIQLMLLIAKLPGGSSRFIPLLLAKVNETLPELVKAMCEAIELPLIALNDPMSPDTRFVYEEEVGRGLYLDLRRER